MPIVLTGAKYDTTLSSAGTTTVTASSANFIAGDFSVARRVDLYNSAGTTFKGTAFVRQRTSSTVLQLETEFFNPNNGNIATQVVGDRIQVSLNWNDVAQTNIVISNETVTISDTITFGTAGSLTSLALHDEKKTIINTLPGSTFYTRYYDVAGGFITFGHLQSYANKTTYNPCTFVFNQTSWGNSFISLSTAARLCLWGGSHINRPGTFLYFGSGFTGVPVGTDWGLLWCLDVDFDAVDILSANTGGNWTTGSNHIIENCSLSGDGTNLILIRFGNGLIVNSTFKLLNNSSQSISIFGTDTAGTYNIEASAGNRSVVADMGNGPILVRNRTAFVNTFNFVNLISTDYRIGTGVAGSLSPNGSGTVNIYFRDNFTNLIAGSVAVLTLDSNGSVVDSVASSGTTWTATVYRRQIVGFTQQFVRGPWTYGIKAYGYAPFVGSITASTFNLGTAGSADNVSFGAVVTQPVDSNVTLSKSAANALSDIATLDQLYDAVINWSVLSTTNAQYPSLSAYPVTANGNVLNFGSRNLVFNPSAGSAVSINTGTNTITIRTNASGLLAGTKFRRFTTTGTVTLQNGAFIEDDDGARWEASGNTFFASRVSHTCLNVATPVANVEVAYFDGGGVNRTYNLSRSSVTTLTSNGSGVVTGYIVYRINSTTYTGHTIRAKQYGFQLYSVPQAISGVAVTSNLLLSVDNLVVAAEGTAAAYTGITITGGSTRTIAVSSTRTFQELYDHACEWATRQANITEPFPISTTDGTIFALAGGWSISVSGNLTQVTKVLANKDTVLTVATNGVFEDRDSARWNVGGTVYFASHAYLQVLNAGTASPISGAVIGFGDGATSTQLTYNLSRSLATLVTDGSGNAEGYFVYRIGATTYADTKQITGDYSHVFSTIPRSLTGLSVGTTSTREVIRLNTDSEVTLSKAAAGAITGITVDIPTDTIDLSAETFSVAYDNLKHQATANADIDTGVPGWLYFQLYGLPLTKSGTTYTGRASGTIYQNSVGTGAIFGGAILQFVTPGTYLAYTFNNVTLHFEGAGTYDFRSAAFLASVTVNTITNVTVLVQIQTGTTFINSDPTNITVEASAAILIGNANLINGTRVRLFNVTQNTELANTTVSGGSGYAYSATVGTGEEVEVGDVITLFATYASGTAYRYPYQESAIASTNNMTFIGTQTVWAHANALGVDGSAQTEFSADFPNVEIDVNASGNVFNIADLVAWLIYIQTTANGIRNFFNAINSIDAGNWIINTSVVDLFIDNINAATATQGDSIILMRDDQIYPQVVPTTGGGGIGMIQSGLVFVTETGVSGLTPSESSKLMSLPTATDVWAENIASQNTANSAGKVLKDAKAKAALGAALSA